MEDVSEKEQQKITEYLRDFVPDKGSPTGDDSIQMRSSILGGYQLAQADVYPEALDWVSHYLEQRNCPLKLSLVLAKDVATAISDSFPSFEVERSDDDDQESEFMLDSGLLYNSVLDKLNEICDRFRNSLDEVLLKTSLLHSPMYKTSVNAIKNTRRKMEDRHVVIHDFNNFCGLENESPCSYYAIFDGHAGVEAASFAAAHLHWNIAKHPEFTTNIEKAIRESFLKTDEDFLDRTKRENIKSGCTAICCILQDKTLYVAWVGDSQAILVRQGSVVSLVEPHLPEREAERQRIEGMGGFLVHHGTWRVSGTLAVSRAIGDPEYKPFVSSDPDIQKVPLDGNEEFIVIACDGLWDRLSPNDTASTVYNHLLTEGDNVDSTASQLVQLSKDQGSSDNISTIVVFLKDPKTITPQSIPESPMFSFRSNPVTSQNGRIEDSIEVQSLMENNPFSQNWVDNMENIAGGLQAGKSIYVYNSGLTVGDPIGSNGPEEIYRPFSGVTLEKTSISELPTPPIEDIYASEQMDQHSIGASAGNVFNSNPFEVQEISSQSIIGENQDIQVQEIASAILNSAFKTALMTSPQDMSDDSVDSHLNTFVGGTNHLEAVPENDDIVPESKPWMLQVQHSVHLNEVDYLPNPDVTDLPSPISDNPFEVSSQLEEISLGGEFNADGFEITPQPPVPQRLTEVLDNQLFETSLDEEDSNNFHAIDGNLISSLSEEAPSTIRALHGIQEMIGISENVPGGKAQQLSTTAGLCLDNPFSSQKEGMCSAFEAMMLTPSSPTENKVDLLEVTRTGDPPLVSSTSMSDVQMDTLENQNQFSINESGSFENSSFDLPVVDNLTPDTLELPTLEVDTNALVSENGVTTIKISGPDVVAEYDDLCTSTTQDEDRNIQSPMTNDIKPSGDTEDLVTESMTHDILTSKIGFCSSTTDEVHFKTEIKSPSGDKHLESEPLAHDISSTEDNMNKSEILNKFQADSTFELLEPEVPEIESQIFDVSGQFTEMVTVAPALLETANAIPDILASNDLILDFQSNDEKTLSRPTMESTPKKELSSPLTAELNIAVLAPMLSMEPTLPSAPTADDAQSPPVVQLENIPDGVPEADGVTEDVDSDSEKDGGWSYMRGSQKKLTDTEVLQKVTTTEVSSSPVGSIPKSPTNLLDNLELNYKLPEEAVTLQVVTVEPTKETSELIPKTDSVPSIKVLNKDVKSTTPKNTKPVGTSRASANKDSAKTITNSPSKAPKVGDKIKPKPAATLKASPIRKPIAESGTLKSSKAADTISTKVTTSSTTRSPKIEKPKVGVTAVGSATLKPISVAKTVKEAPTKTASTMVRKTTASTTLSAPKSSQAVNGIRPISNAKMQSSTMLRKTDANATITTTSTSNSVTVTRNVKPSISASAPKAAVISRSATIKPATTLNSNKTIGPTRPLSATSTIKKTSTVTTNTLKTSSSTAAASTNRITTQVKQSKETANKTLSKNPSTISGAKSSTISRTSAKPGVGVSSRTSTSVTSRTGTITGATKSTTSTNKSEIKPIRKPVTVAPKETPKENGADTDVSETQKTVPLIDGQGKVEESNAPIQQEKFSIEEHTKELQAVDSGLASPESPESPQNGLVNSNPTSSESKAGPTAQPVDQ